jgi:hypothetical protein
MLNFCDCIKTAPLVPHSALRPSGACEDGLAAVSMARAEM